MHTAGFDHKRAEDTIKNFKQFIEDYRDELTALQILYNQPLGKQHLTYAGIRELVAAMANHPPYLTTANVWQAYKRVQSAHVRGAPVDEQLTEVVSLVRYALGQTDTLEPFNAVVQQRFNLWLGREKKAGRAYSDDQQAWLRAIAAREALGDGLNGLLNELQEALVA